MPFVAGRGSDTIIRILAHRMRAALGQAPSIDKRPGGGVMIAANAVAQAPADGHTLPLNSLGVVIAPVLVRRGTLDHACAFATLGNTVSLPRSRLR